LIAFEENLNVKIAAQDTICGELSDQHTLI
jgi:hypothetical protein